MESKKRIVTKELTPDLWNSVEKLFGGNGACGGCWCMSWRLEKGEKWDEIKGSTAKRRFKKGVVDGAIHGILAFVENEPVGWCTFGPRREFPKLDRAPSFKCDDADKVWSIPCFYVKSQHREKGIARALLDHALRAMKKRNVHNVEGYPSKPGKDDRYISSFSWTGTRSLFYKNGFDVVGNENGGKQRVRKVL